jgi:hypothetical protein
LNHALLLGLPVVADKRLHIVTLAPEPDCFWEKRVSTCLKICASCRSG